MDLTTSAGWRRLFLVVTIILAPFGLAALGFAVVNIQGFMRSGWALGTLLACLFIPYSIAYVIGMLRRREARGSGNDGDASPLVFAGGPHDAVSRPQPAAPAHDGVTATTWIWIGLAAVTAYGVFRFAWAMANGASLDWTLVVALVIVACAAAIMPSAIAWQRFLRASARIGGAGSVWPVFRTDQFAEELHRSRRGAVVPQDLILVSDVSGLSVWTTEREPRCLVAMPLDGAVTVRSLALSDRLGRAGVCLRWTGDGETDTFELVTRRKGVFTYFNAGSDTPQRCVEDIERSRR